MYASRFPPWFGCVYSTVILNIVVFELCCRIVKEKSYQTERTLFTKQLNMAKDLSHRACKFVVRLYTFKQPTLS